MNMRNETGSAEFQAPLKWEEIRERISEKARDLIVDNWGGRKLSVPRKAAGSKLEQSIGKADAALLCSMVPGIRIQIPNKTSDRRHERNAEILSDRAHGFSHAQLAIKYHLTERQIFEILRAY